MNLENIKIVAQLLEAMNDVATKLELGDDEHAKKEILGFQQQIKQILDKNES